MLKHGARNGKQTIKWFRKELDMERNKISKHKRRAEHARRFITGVALLGLSGVVAIGCTGEGDERPEVGALETALIPVPGYDPSKAPSNAIGFDIEGCRLDKATEGTYDVTDAPPVLTCDSSATWPDGADAYTDGNLGKEWNELEPGATSDWVRHPPG